MIPTSLLDRRSFIDVENFSDGVTAFFFITLIVQGKFYLMQISHSQKASWRRRENYPEDTGRNIIVYS